MHTGNASRIAIEADLDYEARLASTDFLDCALSVETMFNALLGEFIPPVHIPASIKREQLGIADLGISAHNLPSM